MAAKPRTTGRTTPRLTCNSGSVESTRIIEPKTRLMMPPTVSRPKLVTLISSTSSNNPNSTRNSPA